MRPLDFPTKLVFVEGRQIVLLIKHNAFVTWQVFDKLFAEFPRRGEFCCMLFVVIACVCVLPTRGPTPHSTAQHSTVQHSKAEQCRTQHSTASQSIAQHSAVQHSKVQHSTTQHSTEQHSPAQHSTRPTSFTETQDSTPQQIARLRPWP